MKNMSPLVVIWCSLITLCMNCSTYKEQSPLYYGEYTDSFVIRWGYQTIADHIHDTWKSFPTVQGGVTFDPNDVKPGDIIFVRNVQWFFRNMVKKIPNPFILVTAGDSGQGVRAEYLKYLSNKNIIEWFAIHPRKKTHPKITPIPLGIIQVRDHYENRIKMTKFFAELRNKPREKLLYMNFSGGDKPPYRANRGHVYKVFKDQPYCYISRPKRFKNYLKEMAEFKFALSPCGKDIDCYRTWEALLCGTIPIVKSSHLDPLLKDLPVLIVDEWEEITQEFLERKYEEMCNKKYNIEKLTLEYWLRIILASKKAFLQSTVQESTIAH